MNPSNFVSFGSEEYYRALAQKLEFNQYQAVILETAEFEESTLNDFTQGALLGGQELKIRDQASGDGFGSDFPPGGEILCLVHWKCWRNWLKQGTAPKGPMKYLVFGERPLLNLHLQKWREQGLPGDLTGFGYLRSGHVASFYRFSAADHSNRGLKLLPIGVPILEQTMYILDHRFRNTPVGVSGKLYLTGYLPDANEERIPNPYNRDGNRPWLYDTGKRGLYLADRNLQLEDYSDTRFLVNRRTVDLQLIEEVIYFFEAIRDAALILHKAAEVDQGDGIPAEAQLLAYVVLNQSTGLGVNDLEAYLKELLPDFMIPDQLLEVPSIPLTGEGVPDLSALEAGRRETAGTPAPSSPTAPADEVETRLLEILQKELQRPKIKSSDNLFDLGCSSLKAIQLLARLNYEFGIKLEIQAIFECRDLHELALRIKSRGQTGADPITPVEPAADYPLSGAQKRLWILSQFDQGTVAYNEYVAYRVSGNLQLEAFQAAVEGLVSRHESLRTVFVMVAGEPRQKVLPWLPLEEIFSFVDVRTVPGQEHYLNQVIAREKNEPFDLETGSLMKLRLYWTGNRQYLLTLGTHHLISDGWSDQIIFHDLLVLYQAYSHSRNNPLPDLKIQYKDYAAWLNRQLSGGDLNRHRDFWLSQFQDPIPVLQLPSFKTRPTVQTFRGGMMEIDLPAEAYQALNSLTRENNTTLLVTLLSLLNLLFYKYSQATDIILGTTLADRANPELEDQVGLYINTLAIRTRFNPEESFRDLLLKVKDITYQAMEHRIYPFDQLVDDLKLKPDLGRSALFDVLAEVLNFTNLRSTTALLEDPTDPLEVEPVPVDYETSLVDLTIYITELGGSATFTVRYNADIFEPDQIDFLGKHFLQLLKSVIANPQLPLYEFPVLTEAEQRLLQRFNDTQTPWDFTQTIPGLIEQYARENPDRIAVSYAALEASQNRERTYGEIIENANRIAGLLVANGVGNGRLVGLLMERSILMVESILGIWKAGAAYLPLDTLAPYERIKYMINNGQVVCLIFTKAYLKEANQLQWDCEDLKSLLGIDSSNYGADVESIRESMKPELWKYVVEKAGDEIEAGMWYDSFTGHPFSVEEMDEYAENVYRKLAPYLNQDTKVLEIGCSSGFTMFKVAPLVLEYLGIDLSPEIVERNQALIREQGFTNVKVLCKFAHEIDGLLEKDFDVIIINSVIQYFNGHNYLKQVISKMIHVAAKKAVIFFGDIIDQDLKAQFITDLMNFQKAHQNNNVRTWTDWSEYLFISRRFFEDLTWDFPEIRDVQYHRKFGAIENELTKYRFDTIAFIDKVSTQSDRRFKRHKFQYDQRHLAEYGGRPPLNQAQPDGLAYVIYTSGSTGLPKGVMVEHLGMFNHIQAKIHDLGINRDSIIAQNASQCFDISVWQFFTALAVGGKTRIYARDLVLDPGQLVQRLRKDAVTVLEVVPSYLLSILDIIAEESMEQECLSALQHILVTGEEIKPNLVNRWFEVFPRAPMVNAYGPTEASDDITHYFINHALADCRVPIGRPVQNMRIYIVNDRMQICPIGALGEICVAGLGVGRGYVNDRDKTMRAFMINPFETQDSSPSETAFPSKTAHPSDTAHHFDDKYFLEHPRERFYRTGDLGRWRYNGVLDYFGRKDYQVKIRGYRIELGEIERTILDFPGIIEAAVVDFEDNRGLKYLSAFYVSEDSQIDISVLKLFLGERLPEYMIPGAFVPLKKLPLTPNGKLDRNALCATSGVPTADKEYVAPGNDLELKLANLWQEILGLKQVSITDNFFELGGHSLKATALISKIHKEFNTEVPLKAIFQMPTIRELARFIINARRSIYSEITQVLEQDYYPVSSAQMRLFILQQLAGIGTGYNVSGATYIDGELDRKRLITVFEVLIDRHETLRTSFEIIRGEIVQRVHQKVLFTIREWDLENETTSHQERIDQILDEFIRPFDLAQAPLLRVGLIKLNSRRHLLIYDLHHIIADGTSMDILVSEFIRLYVGEELPPLRIQYKDYSAWQRSLIHAEAWQRSLFHAEAWQKTLISKESHAGLWQNQMMGGESGEERFAGAVFQKQEAYWLDQFQSHGEIPVLHLPADFPRPTTQSFEGDLINFGISSELTEQLNRLALKTGTTLYMTLLAAFNILLAKYSGQEDLVIGSPIAGRPHADLEGIIGMFVNTLALRNYPQGLKTFREFLTEVKENALKAYENQDYPFDELVDKLALKRDLSRNPLFDVMFVLQNTGTRGSQRSGLEFTPYDFAEGVAHFDLTFEAVEQDGKLFFSFEYCVKLFRRETIERMAEHFRNILFEVTANPEIKIAHIVMISETEQSRTDWLRKQESYWLATLGENLPVLNLPLDFPRPEIQSYSGEIEFFRIEAEGAAQLKRIAVENEATLFMVLLAAYNVLLAKYSGQEDLVVGVPIAQRALEDLQEMMGMFGNILALRNYPLGGKTFGEFLQEVKSNLLNAYENQDYPFEELVEKLPLRRDTSRNPVFDVVFIKTDDLNIPGPKFIPLSMEDPTTRCDLILSTEERPAGICFSFQYCNKLFLKETIIRLGAYYANILKSIAADPEMKLKSIEILFAAEKKQILEDFNNTALDYPKGQTLAELFEEQVEKSPDETALVFEDQKLSYRELNQRSNQVADWLLKKGLKSDEAVGLLLERSPELIVAVLGTLKAGGACLPIDPKYPENRILTMLNDSGARVLLSQSDVLAKFRFTALQRMGGAEVTPTLTPKREPIDYFDRMPIPDRTLVDYQKYHRYIGIGAAKNSITIQATRGCPYHCVFCHQIWPKKHVFRSAENIFKEVELYYQIGIRRFVFIDDIFNLNIENSRRFFQMLIDHGLKVQLYFPAGLRGDILTRDYVDLMIAAGTVNFSLSLETASPRLQKLLQKNLDIQKLHDILEYITSRHPGVIVELETMHGIPTETEAEALQTLEFIQSLHWLHFPYLNILKIYPNTQMAKIAMENGISEELIHRASSLGYHQIPDTIPFAREFIVRFQEEFLNHYFLNKERLLKVLPLQMKVLTEDELIQKYNSYLPADIRNFTDILDLARISRDEFGEVKFMADDFGVVPDFNTRTEAYFPKKNPAKDALRILLLDLSQLFDATVQSVYDVVDAPLGLMYLLTNLHEKFGDCIDGKICKSRIDFANYRELKALLLEFKPDIIGIRTLTMYKDFLHQTVAVIRHWGFNMPLILGGPYASSDHLSIVLDPNLDLLVLGEGEATFSELVEQILEHDQKLPPVQKLLQIPGLCLPPRLTGNPQSSHGLPANREILMMDQWDPAGDTPEVGNQGMVNPKSGTRPDNLAYLIYTSGSTGKPKGVMIEQRNLINLLRHEFSKTNIGFKNRVLQYTTICFDVSFQEICSTLLSGGELHLIREELRSDPDKLFGYIEQHQIPIVFLPTAFLKFILNEADYVSKFPQCIRHIITAGEQLIITDKFKEVLRRNGTFLHNHYGPAETHVVTIKTMGPEEALPDIPTIGTPIANTKIYIMDKYQKLMPVGVPGELYISGESVGRGYIHQPDLTSQRFKGDPFHPEYKMYCTGDLAKWLPDGEIKFLGRGDHQVKIRGFRVELEEIELTLLKYNGIREAVVIAKDNGKGEHYLSAYITGEAKLDFSDLRAYLARQFPDYMVPLYFIRLDKLPMTITGKVDRLSLPDPVGLIQSEAGFDLPETETENTLAGIWRDILKLERVGIHDNFFELGGHSLKATTLIAKIFKEFGVDLPLKVIFTSPTISGLTRQINLLLKDKVGESAPHDLIRIPAQEYYPVSAAQRRMYILSRMEPNSVNYNIPLTVVIEGDLNREAFVASFRKLAERHEALRTSFELTSGEPRQRVHEEVEVEINFHRVDATRLPGLTQELVRPFDLSQPPLFRVELIAFEAGKHLLLFDIHHIIADGVSMSILIRELGELYSGKELPELKIQYRDFSQWQNRFLQSESAKKQEEYWLRQFGDEIPVLNLPTDHPRPLVRNFEGDWFEFMAGPELTGRLQTICRESGATLFMVLLGAFNVFLSRYTGQEDLVVGTPIAGRLHADLESVVGMFVNTLALRSHPEGDRSFEEFLGEVKRNTLEAYENQEYQFDELVEHLNLRRDLSQNPLFDVMFTFQSLEDAQKAFSNQGLQFRPYDLGNPAVKFDLTLAVVESQAGINFSFEYCVRLWEKGTVERMARHLLQVLEQVTQEPRLKIAAINLLTEVERQQLLLEFNNTKAEYPREKTIYELFEEQVARTPERIAAVDETRSLSYREFNEKANQVARWLRDQGAGPEKIIGIMVERSIEMLIGIYGIMKAGGAYLPLDPAYPEERLKYILADSGAEILLTQERWGGKVDFSGAWMNLDNEGTYRGDNANLGRTAGANNLAYVIYTSGSTGRPKGVLIEHSPVINR
ncbi:MAG TPA: D-alanine--poly(phosphoribitol) ligase subunit DltA, partial [Bacillota bacterium]|nr:D-alanine--poly(phosphoribitol) ligase subunit DltA [Bacillota bacterium]